MRKDMFDQLFSWRMSRPFQWCKNHWQTVSSLSCRAIPVRNLITQNIPDNASPTKGERWERRFLINFSHGEWADLSNGVKIIDRLQVVCPAERSPRGSLLSKNIWDNASLTKGERWERRFLINFSHGEWADLSNGVKIFDKLQVVWSVERSPRGTLLSKK